MLKKDLEEKVKEYEEIIREIGRWVNPIQYKIDRNTSSKILLRHLQAVINIIDKKYYKIED